MKLFLVRYGKSLFKEKYIYSDMMRSEDMVDFDWDFYIAEYHNKTFLFDNGFRDITFAANWGVRLYDVNDEIKQITYNRPIDYVIITHSHDDHIGNIDLYQNSTVIISQPEYETAINKYYGPIRERLLKHDIVIVKDEYILENFFRFKVIGGHTPGSAVVYFDHADKKYVLAGDECYCAENVNNLRITGRISDKSKNLRFLIDVKENSIIPLCFHDTELFEKKHQELKNIARII